MKPMMSNRMKDVNRGLKYNLKRSLLNSLLLFAIRPLLYLINWIRPPSKKKVIFFANKSVWGDNISLFHAYLFEHSDYKLHIICSDKALFSSLKQEFGSNVSYVYSFSALRHFIEAFFIIISHSTKIRHFFPFYMCLSRKHVLNLWHGIPLKRLNYQIRGYKTRLNVRQQQRYSSFTVCSELEQLIVACCFDMSIDDVVVTNTPRNDLLLQSQSERAKTDFGEYKAVILYAPTWREEGEETRLFPFEDFDPEALDKALCDLGALILVRHHIETGSTADVALARLLHVQLADQKRFPDTQLLLKEMDALVTDYSSIYLDYLLLDRPIIYVPYDEEDYRRYRGFMVDYDQAIAGPKVFTQAGFIAELNNAIKRPSGYSQKRHELCARFHRDVDGKACERILGHMRTVEEA